MAATAKKPTPEQLRRLLAHELVAIHRKHEKALTRADELKAELKAIATDTGNFQEVFPSEGTVKAAGEKEKQFLGNVPELVPESFNALSKTEQNKLIKAGLVKIVQNYSGAYYGRVTVALF